MMKARLITASLALLTLAACGGGGNSAAEQNATVNAAAMAGNSIEMPAAGATMNNAGMSESAMNNMMMVDPAANNALMRDAGDNRLANSTSNPVGGNMQ